VHSIDIDADKLKALKRIVKKVGLKNIRGQRISETGIPFPDKSFDVVIAIEVISHVRDLENTLSEIKRVLKPGGLFFINDGNNSINPLNSIRKRMMQRLSEYNGSKEMGLPVPYVELRKDMIKKKFPKLSYDELEILSVKTKGLWGNKLYDAVNKYIGGGVFLNEHKHEFRNPITGEFQERLFNPYSLVSRLKQIGFRDILVSPSLPISPRRKLIRGLLVPLYPFIFLFSRSFEIIGKV
jgi:SAM-dependent methyltransferase